MAVGMEGVRAIVFDASGTLFDVMAPTARLAARLGDRAEAVGRTWRDKQLAYTWLRSLQGAFAPFHQVTADALDFAFDLHGVDDPALRDDLLALYETLDAYPDARPCLEGLRRLGLKTAILSNGSERMLDAAVGSSGLGPLLDAVFSVDRVSINKPSHDVYRIPCDAWSVAPEEIAFVSGNGWDGKAGAAFGYRAIRLDRAGLPEERLPGCYAARVTTLAAVPGLFG